MFLSNQANNFVIECPVGYYSENCSEKCMYPSYGEECQGECHCSQPMCNFITGCSDSSSKFTCNAKHSNHHKGLAILLID